MPRRTKRRKTTQEKVDSINRKRDLIDGTEISYEVSHVRLVLDQDDRAVLMDLRAKKDD